MHLHPQLYSSRFSDFKVNEIREDGSLVVLAGTGLPEACLAKEEQDKAPVSPETLAAEFERAAGRPPPAELLPFLLRVAQGEVIWDGVLVCCDWGAALMSFVGRKGVERVVN